MRPPPAARHTVGPAPDTDTLARFFHGLADPTRVRILQFLLAGPKTAGEIVRHVGRPQASVAAHVTCLRFCGYVEARRDGRNVWYELIDPRVRQILTLGERYLSSNADQIRACRVIAEEREDQAPTYGDTTKRPLSPLRAGRARARAPGARRWSRVGHRDELVPARRLRRG